MSLIYFHRLLIFCAILFAVFFAYKGFEEWQAQGGATPLVTAGISAAVAVALCFYLRTVKPKRPGGGSSRERD